MPQHTENSKKCQIIKKSSSKSSVVKKFSKQPDFNHKLIDKKRESSCFAVKKFWGILGFSSEI